MSDLICARGKQPTKLARSRMRLAWGAARMALECKEKGDTEGEAKWSAEKDRWLARVDEAPDLVKT